MKVGPKSPPRPDLTRYPALEGPKPIVFTWAEPNPPFPGLIASPSVVPAPLPPRGTPPRGLTLARVLDVLYAEPGRPLMAKLEADLIQSGVRLDTGPGGYVDHDYRPKDRFLAGLTDRLYLFGLQESRVPAALPQAVIHLLADATDDSGTISRARVRELFGQKGAQFLQSVEKRFGSTWHAARPQLDTLYLSEDLLAKVAARRAAPPTRAQMPALGVVADYFADVSLDDAQLLAQQHLFPTSRAVFAELRAKGLSSGNILGKPYSTDPTTYGLLHADGFTLCDASLEYNRGPFFIGPEPVNSVRLDQVAELIGEEKAALIEDDKTLNAVALLAEAFAFAPPGKKLLLMDDGGVLIRAMHTYFPQLVDRCVAVEQTERGAAELEGMELGMPVVNVARSWAKKLFESAMIGESVADSVDRAIADMSLTVGPPKEAAVLGYGAVGKATAEALRRRGYTVHVYDQDAAAMGRAKDDGCQVGERAQVLAHGHLLISATGHTAITPQEFGLLPDHAVVANAASENHELGMNTVPPCTDRLTPDPLERLSERGVRRTTFRGRDVALGDFAAFEEKFHRVLRGEDGRETLVLRSGYVVNMGVDIPAPFIQLTRALMLAGALQASRTQGTGLIALDEKVQTLLVDAVREHLRGRGLSLETPDFRGLG